MMNADEVVADVKKSLTEKKRARFTDSSRIRSVRRPEEVLRDVRGLKLRQRVSLVLSDEILREELEESIKNSTVNGVTKSDTIRAYQDILLPALQPNLISVGKGYGGSTAVLPINDIRGESTVAYSKSERLMRCKLAAGYRLVDIFGWSEGIFNHISLRVHPGKDEFLLNPFGLLYHEVSASTLAKCDGDGNMIDGGTTNLGINKAGFVLHSAIHEARPDINCIFHVHIPDVAAVSSMKCGLLRLSQTSLIVGGVSYHDYCGILVDENEKVSIQNDLGPENMVLFLRNHGVAVCGKTIEDAFSLLFNVIEACKTQMNSVRAGLENLNIISDEAYEQVQQTLKNGGNEVVKGDDEPRMSISEYTFEAYMRLLDSQGYRTGYAYHMPDLFISGNSSKKKSEARVPPIVPSFTDSPYQVYNNFHESSPYKIHSMGRGNTHRSRLKWLNSPVVGTQYIKEEKKRSMPPLTEAAQKEAFDDAPMSKDDNPIKNCVNSTTVVNGHADDEEYVIVENVIKDQVVQCNGEKEAPKQTNDKNNVKESVKVETILVTESSSQETKITHTTTELLTNGENIVNDSDNPPLMKERDELDICTPSKSNINALSDTSLNILSDGELSPKTRQKVKKQKSFKKALMKKFNKKE